MSYTTMTKFYNKIQPMAGLYVAEGLSRGELIGKIIDYILSFVLSFFPFAPNAKSSDEADISPATLPMISTSTNPLYDCYYRHLAAMGHGIPIWIPEPNENLNIDYRKQGASIGDVIFFTRDGALDFIFNVCLPADHPVNSGGVPAGFIPFAPELTSSDKRRYQQYGCDSYLASKSITKEMGGLLPAGVLFRSSASEGAILTMPEGAYSEDLTRVSGFDQYLSENLSSWYKYVNEDRQWGVKMGELHLVTGVHKANSWGIATFQFADKATAVDVNLQIKANDIQPYGTQYSWEYKGVTDSPRTGPTKKQRQSLFRSLPEDERGQSFENQCLFVRTVNSAIRDSPERDSRVDGMANHVDNSTQSDSSANERTVGSKHTTSSVPNLVGTHGDLSGGFNINYNLPIMQNRPALRDHPSKAINDFLLKERPNGKIVITHDEHWISLLTEDDVILPTGDELVARLKKAYRIIEDNEIISLEPINAYIAIEMPENGVSTPQSIPTIAELQPPLPAISDLADKDISTNVLASSQPKSRSVTPHPAGSMHQPRHSSQSYEKENAPPLVDSFAWGNSSQKLPESEPTGWNPHRFRYTSDFYERMGCDVPADIDSIIFLQRPSPPELRSLYYLQQKALFLSNSLQALLGLYFALNLTSNLYNKTVLIHFPFPYTLTAMDALCNTITLFVLLRLAFIENGLGSRLLTPNSMFSGNTKGLIGLSLCSILCIIVTNASLHFVAVPSHKTVNASPPFFTIIFAVVLLGRGCSRGKLFTLIPVVAGVGFATYRDRYFAAFGFLTLLGAVVAALAMSRIFSPSPSSSPDYSMEVTSSAAPSFSEITWFQMTWVWVVMVVCCGLVLVPAMLLAYITGELNENRVRWYLFPSTDAADGPDTATASECYFWLILHGLLMCILTIVSFNLSRRIGLLGMGVTANVQQVLTMLCAVVIFDQTITFTNGVGIALTLLGGALYVAVERREREANNMPGCRIHST